MQERKIVFIVPLLWTVSLLTLFFLAVVNGWFGPATDVGGDFCEAARDGYIKQPANTWSNIGFITAGLASAWLLMTGKYKQNSNALTRSNFTAVFFSCLAIFLGPGSMAMHATETEIGGELDMLSMYLVCSFMTAYAMQRFYNWKPLQFTAVFVLAIIICEVAGLYHKHIPLIDYAGNLIFAFFISLAVVFEMLNSFVRKKQHEKKWGIFGLISLITAFIIWNFWKNDSPLCDPYSLIQGHAIWHLLDALAVFFLFRFYVSEHSET
jgi:hypothetical protein